MADFTIELHNVIDVVGADGIGLNDYPIFNEEYRKTLNLKIIDHYWYNEIAHESIDIFIRQMRAKMNEIMPYFNQLYLSEAAVKKIDFMTTVDATSTSETSSRNASSTTSSQESSSKGGNSSDSSTRSRTVASDMPQTRLAGDADYATAATDVGSDVKAASTSEASDRSRSDGSVTGDTSSQAMQRQYGRSGAPASLLNDWRNSFLNIDMMVIEALSPLFMLIWSSNDSYFEEGNVGLI